MTDKVNLSVQNSNINKLALEFWGIYLLRHINKNAPSERVQPIVLYVVYSTTVSIL